MPNEELSLAQGAIAPWAEEERRPAGPARGAGGSTCTFSLDTRRGRSCRPKARDAILNGTGDEEITFVYERGEHRRATSSAARSKA